MLHKEHFINNIELINYKIFKNFAFQGFEQVNLIGGCNNVGKTALMEALYIHIKGIDINRLINAVFSVAFMRQNINLLVKCTEKNGLNDKDFVELLDENSNFLIQSNIRSVEYKLIDTEGIKEYFFKIDKDAKSIPSSSINIPTFNENNIRFIDNFGLSDTELKNAYESVQLLEKEKELNQYITIFDEEIESFKFIGDIPMCKLIGNNKYYALTSSFGDGLKSYIALICSIYASSNGQLFIDEIDNGIHYTQFDNIWKIIEELAKEVNCQVFAVTHSLEMIESFNRVQQKINSDSAYFELARDRKNKKIMMNKLDYRQLKYELGNKGRFRGE